MMLMLIFMIVINYIIVTLKVRLFYRGIEIRATKLSRFFLVISCLCIELFFNSQSTRFLCSFMSIIVMIFYSYICGNVRGIRVTCYWSIVSNFIINFISTSLLFLLGKILLFFTYRVEFELYWQIIAMVPVIVCFIKIYFIINEIEDEIFYWVNDFLIDNPFSYGLIFLSLLIDYLYIQYTVINTSPGFVISFLGYDTDEILFIFYSLLFGTTICIQYAYYKDMKKLNEKTVATLREYLNGLEKNQEDLNMFRHDYKNLLYSLRIAIDSEDIQSVRNIFNNVIAPTEIFFKMMDTSYAS